MVLESVKNQVKILTDSRLQSEQQRKLTEENCIRLQTELDVLKRDLDERQNDLKKERMRIEKFIRQEEVILPSSFSSSFSRLQNSQSKEKSLMENNEQVVHQCQLFKNQLSQQNHLQKDYQQLLEEMKELKLNVAHRSNENTLSMFADHEMFTSNFFTRSTTDARNPQSITNEGWTIE